MNFLRLFIITTTCFVSSSWTALPGGDCVEPCISEMQRSLEETPMLQQEHLGQLSFSQLIGASHNKHVTEQSFTAICKAYISVDSCLERCEKTSENSGRIRQTYAGIRFICVEQRNEFFSSLPCLAKVYWARIEVLLGQLEETAGFLKIQKTEGIRQEAVAMEQCQRQINESLVASNRFSLTVMKKEHHNLRNHFETLCRKLGSMIECVEPVTRHGCGDQAAIMMLKFITVGFSSFEQLYSQLGISDQLPASCKSLLSLRRRMPSGRSNGISQRQTDYGPLTDHSSQISLLSVILLYLSFY